MSNENKLDKLDNNEFDIYDLVGLTNYAFKGLSPQENELVREYVMESEAEFPKSVWYKLENEMDYKILAEIERQRVKTRDDEAWRRMRGYFDTTSEITIKELDSIVKALSIVSFLELSNINSFMENYITKAKNHTINKY